MTIRFLLVCEGSSDAALIPHIRKLLIRFGQADPEGSAWYGTGSLADKIREGLRYFSDCDLLFVHRDADASRETRSAGAERRRSEIGEAVRDSGFTGPRVGIVPVRMTESWLLLDHEAIRHVAGRPQGNAPLGLPLPAQAENVADPKERLEQALLTASGLSGRRMSKLKRDIPHLRRLLLEELPVNGPLEQVSSWVRFRDDLVSALACMETG